MEQIIRDEMDHISELLRLRGSIKDEYLSEFIDSAIRETYLRLRLLEILNVRDLPPIEGPREEADVVERLNEMCKHYEAHLSMIRSLRNAAKTPLELEVIASIEKSVERTHLALRMLINALTNRG